MGSLFARCNAVDGERLEPLLVLLELTEAEVPERVRVAADALHQHVVALAGLVVRPARALLADNVMGEVIEGA